MISVLMNFIEVCYVYKTSYLYTIHLLLMILVSALLIFSFVKEREIIKK